jgi:hypothetical protein
MCKGTLWIDLSSGKIVDHKSADQAKANFDDFLKAQKKGTAWDDKMKKAKEEETKRKAEIEMKFKKAKDTPLEADSNDKLKSPLDWD